MNASVLSSGPIVKTAGKQNFIFSCVIASRRIEKSKGVIENLDTFGAVDECLLLDEHSFNAQTSDGQIGVWLSDCVPHFDDGKRF
jgi:hypothetical protein